jgi:hypothetical protein
MALSYTSCAEGFSVARYAGILRPCATVSVEFRYAGYTHMRLSCW